MASMLTTGEGGVWELMAVTHHHPSDPSESMEVFLDGKPTGLFMMRNSLSDTFGVFNYRLSLPTTVPSTEMVVELRARSRSGTRSIMWPYLIVE